MFEVEESFADFVKLLVDRTVDPEESDVTPLIVGILAVEESSEVRWAAVDVIDPPVTAGWLTVDAAVLVWPLFVVEESFAGFVKLPVDRIVVLEESDVTSMMVVLAIEGAVAIAEVCGT